MPLRNGDVIHTLRPPSSGVLLGFMLQVLEGKFILYSINIHLYGIFILIHIVVSSVL